MSNLEFYLARADQARADANAATLGHVRERWLRSQAAWTQLADRAARSDHLRTEEIKRKADQAAEMNHEKQFEKDILETP